MELTGTRVDDLPGYVVDRLETTIPAQSLADARDRADRLVAEATQEQGEDATTGTGTPGETVTDGTTDGSSDGTPQPTPTVTTTDTGA
ncbi:hypothetical protein [Cellulosimicrobium sp. CUA-896]|uniref:hypothetical protein n=1 Tax=Cellulosimicrobium sp. CUA-896 TaxID=1517881 RepID=UPI0035146DE0